MLSFMEWVLFMVLRKLRAINDNYARKSESWNNFAESLLYRMFCIKCTKIQNVIFNSLWIKTAMSTYA
jgi:hypothetical protein